jgi:Zn-dependent membrane protease YugP
VSARKKLYNKRMRKNLLGAGLLLSGIPFISCLGNETIQSISETELFSLPYGNFEEQLSVSDINEVGNVRFGIAMQDGFFYIVNGESKKILELNGLYNVEVEHVSGNLTDHYDPSTRTVRLSDAVYNETSIAALGVAAHECGHAIQHSKQYAPLGIRSALVPVANFGATISWPLVLLGLFMNANLGKALIIAGVLMFFAAVMFHVVTLPVEFDASRRALKNLREFNLVDEGEVEMARKVLTAAALTYVAGTISALLQFLRLLLIVRSYTDDDE